MHIWWQCSMWVTVVPGTTLIPSFVNVAHIELWIFAFVIISQSEQICKWAIQYAYIWWRHNTWVRPVPTTTYIPSFMKIGHCMRFTFLLTSNPRIYIHTSMSRQWDRVTMKPKWSFQQIYGGPQKSWIWCNSFTCTFLPPDFSTKYSWNVSLSGVYSEVKSDGYQIGQ